MAEVNAELRVKVMFAEILLVADLAVLCDSFRCGAYGALCYGIS